MVSSFSLLQKFSDQMKARGIFLLFSIRKLLGFIGALTFFLAIGFPFLIQICALVIGIYYLTSSYLIIYFLKQKSNKVVSYVNPLLVLDFVIIMGLFYITIFIYEPKYSALPLHGANFYTLIFFYLLYTGFVLDKKFTILMSIASILGYIGAIFLTITQGSELYMGAEFLPPTSNRVILKLEILKIFFLTSISVCYVKLVSFLLGIIEQNNAELAQEIEQREVLLIKNDRIVVLGNLAANIAHEINNPLAGLKASIESLFAEDKIFLETLNDKYDTKFLHWDNAVSFLNLSRKEKNEKEQSLNKIDFGLSPNQKEYLIDKSIQLGVEIPFQNDNNLFSINSKLSFLLWLRYRYKEKVISIMINSIERTEKIIKSFTHFSQPILKDDLKKVSLEESLNEILFLYSHFWFESRSLEKNIQTDFSLLANEQSLKLIFSHLIYNAIQATSNKNGKISVRVFTEGKVGVVEIEDNGIGIPKDLIQDIFVPFFTTKAVGEGSGLGLAIVKEVVLAHEGNIICTSEPGKTVFRLTFPIYNFN